MYINAKNNAAALEYSQSTIPLINELCQQFFSAIGLSTFIYVRVFYDGKYVLLSNQNEWLKHWIQNLFTIKNTTFEMSLQNVPEKDPFYFLWDIGPKDNLIQSHNNFGIWHGFDIDFRLEDSVEVWAFGASSDQVLINNFYLNNIKLLHRFCLHFREKAAEYLKIQDKTPVAYFEEPFDISFHSSLIKAEEANLFLPLLLPDSFSLQTKNGYAKLSKREIECMLHLVHGKTAKETAKILNISPRTVESYITSTKFKTGLYTKSDLSDLLKGSLLKWL